MDNTVVDFLDRMQTVDDASLLKDEVQTFLSGQGFEIFAYIGFPDDDAPQTINNHPDEWLNRYAEENYLLIDPVIDRARYSRLPFSWSEIDHTVNDRERLVLNEGSEVGICSGATVPVFGNGREAGLFFLSSDKAPEEFDKIWTENKYSLHLIALYLHATYFDKVLHKQEQPVERLTPREKECLLWTARGKTAWETSEILHISEGTAVFHTKNACKKLNTHSKVHAVVKAIMLGIITP